LAAKLRTVFRCAPTISRRLYLHDTERIRPRGEKEPCRAICSKQPPKQLAAPVAGTYFAARFRRTGNHMTTTTELGYDSRLETDVVCTKLDTALNWFRQNSLWPMPMGLACCAIELMGTGASRFDISRFGMEVMRFSPRQSDVMIVAGTVTYKMATVVKRIYDQMAEPKWVIAMGACASTGGMYRSYAVLQGVDNIIPVDFYVAGCPPRPEALLDAMMKLQKKVMREPLLGTLKRPGPALPAGS